MDEISIFKRRLERETAARKEAEQLLETKALALYHANENLRKLNEGLEQKVRDRTEELRRSEEKYRGIIEGMELGLLEVDLEHRIVRAFEWFCDMTGYIPQELEGKNAVDIFTKGKLPEVMKKEDERRKRGQAGVYETQIYKKDGTQIWVLISGAPIYNSEGDIIGSLGIHYDITERKRLEEELKKAKQAAEAAQEAEKEFLARMSHEIRTPLNAVIGMVYLLYDSQPTDEQKDYLNALKTSADILLKLISDVLDISKIEAGEVTVNQNEFDLGGLLQSLQKTFQMKVGDQVEVRLSVDSRIKRRPIGDDLLLNQVLMNLLGNAAKFTESGTIEIQVYQIEKSDDDCILEFTVSDTGIGISKKDLELIFQNFKQAEEFIDDSKQGSGLGLAICKQLVELQGGEIRAESRKGIGTSFVFNLPYRLSSNELQTEIVEMKLPEFNASSEKKVLVVEDNFMNRKYLGALLQKWNIAYEIAGDGQEAWEKAQKEKFGLILMDISMPIMDGFQATLKIRNQNNLNRKTPIAALTASAILSQKEKAIQSGMNDFLSKPFHPEQILGLLKKYIKEDIQAVEDQLINSVGFKFNKKLDRVYLDDLYKDDLEYAADMFETFLNYTVPEFLTLGEVIFAAESKLIRNIAHKIKPTFAMVGLTALGDKILEIEQLAPDMKNKEKIKKLYESSAADLSIFKPILLDDLNKMRLVIENY